MTSQETKDRDDDELAAEYALGTLPLSERLSFERRLLDDNVLRKSVEWWNTQFAPMSDSVDAVAPSPAVLKRIEERLFPEQIRATSWLESLGLWRGLTAASVAGMLVFGGLYASSTLRQDIEPSVFVAQLSDINSDVELVAYYDGQTQTLRLNRTSGAALPNRSLELWVIPTGEKPISLGILPEDAVHEIPIPQELRAAVTSQSVLAVTDEPEGGSPSGDPTGPVLAAGSITKV